MTQATSQIGADQSGLAYRNADNAGKEAILNHHMGATAPSYAEAGIIWLNNTATPWTLNIYTGTNWITLGAVNASTNTFNPYTGAAPDRLLTYAADTGAANAYAVAPSPVATAYAAGQIVTLKPANANTGASTLNVNGLGTVNIKLFDGTIPYANALLTTGTYTLVYDGTNFVLTNPGPLTSYLNYAADTGSANAYAVAPSPPAAAYAAGQCVMLKPGNANTGASTINVNGLGTKNIKMPDGTTPSANVLVTTGCYYLMYDGTNFVLQNPSPLALTGDVTTSGAAATLATVNSNVGSFTAANITVNAKGLITAAASGAASTVGYNAQTTTYAPVAGDLGKLVDFTGSSSATFTLTAAATLGNGWYCYIRNNGASAAVLTLASSSGTIDGIATTGYPMYPGEERLVQCTGSAFNTLILKGFNWRITSTATFYNPPGYKSFRGFLWGSGGAGGKGATNGGGGGGGGACVPFDVLSATIGAANTATTITIGAGGAGQTTANASGNHGNSSTFGSLFTAYGGGGGAGGSLGAGGGGGGAGTFLGTAAVSGLGATGITTTAGAGGPGPDVPAGATSPASGSGMLGGACGGIAATETPNTAVYGGGGGGCSVAATAVIGGSSIWGGGGGAPAISTGTGGLGGTSNYGGAGGQGVTGANAGNAGTAPGGGGGGAVTGTSGAGGAGGCEIQGYV